MSTDRETRQRLEEVQTRLRDLEPELDWVETPGFAEQLAARQGELKTSRQGLRELEARLGWARDEVAAVRADVQTLHLAVQATQTVRPPAVLNGALVLGVVPAILWGMGVVVANHLLDVVAASAICLGSAFALGMLIRVRVLRPEPDERVFSGPPPPPVEPVPKVDPQAPVDPPLL